jgi:hypothetical protein
VLQQTVVHRLLDLISDVRVCCYCTAAAAVVAAAVAVVAAAAAAAAAVAVAAVAAGATERGRLSAMCDGNSAVWVQQCFGAYYRCCRAVTHS